MDFSPDPICPICSKPFRSVGFVESSAGQSSHVRCRAQQLHLRTLEQIDRAKAVEHRASRLVEEAGAWLRAKHQPGCPLCAYPATLTDWRPEGADWIVVENCACAGFFLWAPIIERVRALPVRDRHDLAHRVRAFRVRHEAWVATTNGTVTGPLVVRTRRPDRLSEV